MVPPRRAACVSPCRIIGSAAATRFRTLRDPGVIRTQHHSPRRRLYVRMAGRLLTAPTGVPRVAQPSSGNRGGSYEGGPALSSRLRDNRAAPILMAQEMMTAFDPQNVKSNLREHRNEVGASDAQSPAHAAMVTRWMPMNSNSWSGRPSTSRHSSMASRMRSLTSSRERACVWQAGIWGTEAT